MITELGHGLDINNMETTATLLPSGEFLLHSPTPAAAKYAALAYFVLTPPATNAQWAGSCLPQYLPVCRA